VKDALVRKGVPAQSITVIGRGEAGLVVQTADGVRAAEPPRRNRHPVDDERTVRTPKGLGKSRHP